jgi:hypothetical protein
MWRNGPALAFGIVVVASSAIPAQAQWARCGGEKDDCVMSSPAHNLVRYGKDSSWFYLEVQGMTKVPCNNSIMGDPKHSDSKTCEYRPAPAAASNESWTNCANENGTCSLPIGTPRRVRFGDGNQWVYKIYSNVISCNAEQFKIWPASFLPKHCEYSNQPYNQSATQATPAAFQDCGTEDNQCTLGTSVDPMLVRYGAENRFWEYRVTSAADLVCNNDTFGGDPVPGDDKFCQFSTVPPTIISAIGGWKKVGTCISCTTLNQNVQVGISDTRATTSTSSWTQSVAEKLGFKEGDAKLGGEISAEVTYSFSNTQTESLMQSLQRSTSTTMSAACAGKGGKIDMFQWGLDVNELCWAQGGQCHTKIDSFNILCAEGQAANYAPRCMPAACTDALCQVCEK